MSFWACLVCLLIILFLKHSVLIKVSLTMFESCYLCHLKSDKSVEERMQGRPIIFLSVLTTGLRAACSLADAAALIWSVVMQDRCGMNRILAYGYTDVLYTTVLLYLTCEENSEKVGVREA